MAFDCSARKDSIGEKTFQSVPKTFIKKRNTEQAKELLFLDQNRELLLVMGLWGLKFFFPVGF